MCAAKQNTPTRFNPFTDRRSRDIRNGLSEALVEAMAADDQVIYHRAASKWLSMDLPPAFESYIRDRLDRYDQVLSGDSSPHPSRPFARFIDIWNQGLFFEAHEYLETIWQRTSGDMHKALKGLIKAAGVYVHLENNNQHSARRLGPKALRQMKDHAHCLSFIANLDTLLACIERLDPVSPQLVLEDNVDFYRLD